MKKNNDEIILYGEPAVPFDNLEKTIIKANDGDSGLCYSLANYYKGHEENAEHGSWKVVKRDFNAAIKWAKKCAELGNSNGYAMLGRLYSSNEAVFKSHIDKVKAIEYFRKGSEQGNLYCSYRLANLLIDLSAADYITPINRSFFNPIKENAEEALTLFLKVYDEIKNAYYREKVAEKIASCHATLGNLESALEWYKKGNKSELEEEISDLKTILKYHPLVKELEEQYKLKPSVAKARKIAEAYYKLATIGQNWFESNEYLDINRKAIHWLKMRKNQLEEEIADIGSQIATLDGDASFVRILLRESENIDNQ